MLHLIECEGESRHVQRSHLMYYVICSRAFKVSLRSAFVWNKKRCNGLFPPKNDNLWIIAHCFSLANAFSNIFWDLIGYAKRLWANLSTPQDVNFSFGAQKLQDTISFLFISRFDLIPL